MEVTTAIHLDTRRMKKDGTYPVRIRVTYNRVRKYYTISNSKDVTSNKYNLTVDDYEAMMGKSVRGKLKELKEELVKAEQKAREIINTMDVFSFGQFEQLFNERKVSKQVAKTIKYYFDANISELEKNGDIGNSDIYKNARNSFFTFWPENLKFDELTPNLLKTYKTNMLNGDIKKGIPPKSITTVSIYTRCLRALYNSAIIDGVVSEKLYPFGKTKNKKFEVPKPNNIKKALTIEEIKKILEYVPASKTEEYYRDIWVFCYLSYGMNVGDVCDLKYSDLHQNRLLFRRNKTENKSPIQLQVLLTDKHNEIIEKYGTKEDFVFPVLNAELTPKAKKKTIKQFTKMVNKYMKRIALKLEITEDISTQYARHSFATIARNGKIPDGIISQLMGHSMGKSVTSNYFDNEVPDFILEEVNRVLIN